MKIELDKYYTSLDLSKKCIATFQDVAKNNDWEITEYLEPSAGNGSFSLQLDNCVAYDIAPEHESIIEQDFLKLDIIYKKGRCIIGNPPFGNGMKIATKFYKKSVKICDYIAFILPISQYNQNVSFYEFDLVYSEDLGITDYSTRKLHCCFNIYKRNESGRLNNMMFDELNGLSLFCYKRSRKYKHEFEMYDFSICSYGSSIGKLCDYNGQFVEQVYFMIRDKSKVELIKEIIVNVAWKKEFPSISTPRIMIHQIVSYLKKNHSDLFEEKSLF